MCHYNNKHDFTWVLYCFSDVVVSLLEFYFLKSQFPILKSHVFVFALFIVIFTLKLLPSLKLLLIYVCWPRIPPGVCLLLTHSVIYSYSFYLFLVFRIIPLIFILIAFAIQIYFDFHLLYFFKYKFCLKNITFFINLLS